MTHGQIDAYRAKLLALAQRVQLDTASIESEALRGTGGEASGNLSNAPLHPADLATDQNQQDVALGIFENEANILRQADAALRRIDEGAYGRCENCGGDISTARLDAVPYTAYCVDCAAKLQAEGNL
ncbi:MAG: TraR/DksA C4-type zinc finger protein [Gemmataceae bacterium]|nr:TraR/DksA C4-type zinc finger protein [Gemmataceae bacterium]